MARYLITGATGFLGEELVERLKGDGLVVIARNESKLVSLKEKYPNIKIVIGDICKKHTFYKVGKVDGVFHLAAMKHIGIAEDNPRECIDTNVIGTINLLEYALETKPNFVLGISTDKAAQVKGVYGATKLLMERLFVEQEQINPQTKYRIVRYGNVLYSSGSVLCKWRDKLSNGDEIVVTDPRATRFFWTVKQAVDLIFECLLESKDATPHITKMKSMAIGDLVEAMMDKYGHSKIKEIGLQPGENMHETIDGKTFSNEVEQYTKEEILDLI